MFRKLFCVLVFSLTHTLWAQSPKDNWVDSVYQALSADEKLGQLFFVEIDPTQDPDFKDKIREAVKSHRVGGLVLTGGTPKTLISIQNYAQSIGDVPLLIGLHADAGGSTTLDSTMSFPFPITLGAVSNDSLLFELGRAIGQQMNSLGIHLTFSPSPELTNLSKLDSLSFGENEKIVARKAVALAAGLKSRHVLSCAKSFPILGLTVLQVTDNIPEVDAYIDTVRIFPYLQLMQENIAGIVPASKNFPLFYDKKSLVKKNAYPPSLLSSLFAGSWIKQNTNYAGILFVDMREMLSEDDPFKPGEAEGMAFEKGFNAFLFSNEVTSAKRRLRRIARRKKENMEHLESSVKKILAAKYDARLASPRQPLHTDNLELRLHSPEARNLNRKLLESTVTLIQNDKKVLPIVHLEENRIAAVSVGRTTPNTFTEICNKYTRISEFYYSESDTSRLEELAHQWENFETILVPLYEKPDAKFLNKLKELQKYSQVVLVSFGSPSWLSSLHDFQVVIQTYEQPEQMSKIVPQSIFGALPITGRLPYTIDQTYAMGRGENTPSLGRLGFADPEDVGMDSRALKKIDEIAFEAISSKGTPGCQVVVAKNGKVVWNRCYGYLTYDSTTQVTEETIYDLASITKVMATLQTMMFLYDKGQVDVYRKASFYLPELNGSNKQDFTIKDILTHQAGLWPFLPFWADTMNPHDTSWIKEYYDTIISNNYPFQVARNLYATKSIKERLWKWIIDSKIRDKPTRAPYTYRYSDMGFYIFQHIAEKLLNQPIQDFMDQNFYEPMGASTMGYQPLQQFSMSRIAPTEDDKVFRKQLLIGTVHDQGAAMHGGIAGHAGLFSNALDLTKMGQMLLQDGYYGGIQYFTPETVHYFTQKQFNTNRRGLGWDKPAQSDWNSPTSLYASPKTFGHTGFTGTAVWIDPEFDLVYVFLSNRVYPDMTNNKLLRENIRSRIQDTLYKSIFSYRSNHY